MMSCPCVQNSNSSWNHRDMWCSQRTALERMAELEDENAALKDAAQRRSAVLQQSRSFITSYLEVCHPMIRTTLLLTSGCMGCQQFLQIIDDSSPAQLAHFLVSGAARLLPLQM